MKILRLEFSRNSKGQTAEESLCKNTRTHVNKPLNIVILGELGFNVYFYCFSSQSTRNTSRQLSMFACPLCVLVVNIYRNNVWRGFMEEMTNASRRQLTARAGRCEGVCAGAGALKFFFFSNNVFELKLCVEHPSNLVHTLKQLRSLWSGVWTAATGKKKSQLFLHFPLGLDQNIEWPAFKFPTEPNDARCAYKSGLLRTRCSGSPGTLRLSLGSCSPLLRLRTAS